MAKSREITLVGGPGDGERHMVEADVLQIAWRPKAERELVAARMHGRDDHPHRPILYRQSLSTKSLFVYQP